jgi:predicted Zn-dependent peptidase
MPNTLRALSLIAITASIAVAQQPQAPPAPGTPKDFRLPPKTTFTLDNGMQVVMVPFGVIPKATVRVVLRGGNVNEKPNETWLADVTGDMLREGTTSRTAQQVSQALAEMGGALGVRVSPDQTRIDADVLTERVPDAVRLLADVVRHPRLPASELPRIRANRLRQLAIQRSQPQPLAEERFAKLIYGDHPYGRIFPTEAMLRSYTAAQVRKFYADNYGARRAKLYVAGVFDRAATEQAIRAAFGDWTPGTAAAVTPRPKPRTQRQFALIDRPNAPQSTIYLGVPVPDPSQHDWIALQTTDALLGGAFSSRITTNIREQKGYTYSPYSSVRPHYRDATWVEVADVTTNVTGASLKEIIGEVERLQKEAPPQAELRGIQNNLAGIFTLQNASRDGVIDRLAFVDLHGLGDDYLTQYVKRVLAVTPSDVQRVTREYLRPERMTLVIVGDKRLVTPQVTSYIPSTPVP